MKEEYSDKQPIFSRRTLLTTLLISLGAVALKLGGIAWSFLIPPKRPNSFGGVIDAGTINELPMKGGVPLHVPHGRFWLVHDDPGIWALHSSCTHLDCLLSWDREKWVFVCPCHGSEFSRNGDILKGPAQRPLERFPITLSQKEDKILRSSEDHNGGPLPVADLLDQKAHPLLATENDGIKPSINVQVDTGFKIIRTSEIPKV